MPDGPRARAAERAAGTRGTSRPGRTARLPEIPKIPKIPGTLRVALEEPWSQFHGGYRNRGALDVETPALTQARWQIEVAPALFASPVLGPGGAVHLTTPTGMLAINPDGTERWRVEPPAAGRFMSSAAVDSAGNTYAVSTVKTVVRDHRGGSTREYETLTSTLHRVAADGALNWSRRLPSRAAPSGDTVGYTTAAPKVWECDQGTAVIVPVSFDPVAWPAHGLAVFTGDGDLLVDQELPWAGPVGWQSSNVLDDLKAIWDFFTLSFDPAKIPPRYPQDPTVAIVDDAALGGSPLLLVHDNACTLTCYRFEWPAVREVWYQPTGDGIAHCSSPAAFDGCAAITRGSGEVFRFDYSTGAALAGFRGPQPSAATPSGFDGAYYLVSCADSAEDKLPTTISLFNAEGTLVRAAGVGARTAASPAVTRNHVHVATDHGLWTFNRDLSATEAGNPGVQSGFSTPAVGHDGRVYVAGSRALYAF